LGFLFGAFGVFCEMFQSLKLVVALLELAATLCVATLALGSQPRQGLAKVRAKSEPGNHISCSRECKKVEGMNPPTLGIGVPMDS